MDFSGKTLKLLGSDERGAAFAESKQPVAHIVVLKRMFSLVFNKFFPAPITKSISDPWRL